MVEKCQITVVVVVGDFGVLTIQLWKLIIFTRLGENIFGWSHSKKHKKIFQNLINFVQFHSEMALQWPLKVQWKLCISGVWTISFRWAISSKEMEIKIEISNFLIKFKRLGVDTIETYKLWCHIRCSGKDVQSSWKWNCW